MNGVGNKDAIPNPDSVTPHPLRNVRREHEQALVC
jgi:hypothetical protein